VQAPALATNGLTPLSFDDVYTAEFAFVWRNLRRLGVAEDCLGDAAQDVFLVLHRKLPEFEGRAPLRSFVYSVVKRVASEHRRARGRNEAWRGTDGEKEVPGPQWHRPDHEAEQSEALRLLLSLLATLDDDKRDAFVLAELEGMTAPEIAVAVGANVNTVYARIRAARAQIRNAWAEYQSTETRRP
jgi:RNA polymerase sigma-70 factor (ECF subfamily)